MTKRLALYLGLLCLVAVQWPAAGVGMEGKDVAIAETTAGEEFTVRLPSNPTTGYAWQFLPTGDRGTVQFVSTVYEPPKTDRAGAGGTEIWTFRALCKGEARIEFIYVRS